MRKMIKKFNIPLICILCAIFLGSIGIMIFKIGQHYGWFSSLSSNEAARICEEVGFTFGNLNTPGIKPRELDIEKKRFFVLEDLGKGIMAVNGIFLYPVALNPDYQIKNIDFSELSQVNNEVVGYLEFENLEVISYPVYWREGTEYYLKHNRYLQYDKYGELYVEGHTAQGHSRTNTIIYGHNMRNGTMFGSLKAYKDGAYYPGNEFFWYYTKKGKYRYQIFTVYETLYNSDTFTWFEKPADDYTAYLQKMKSQQKYETGVTPNPEDEIITLCTCTSRGGNYRLILQGRMVYKEEF